jgi:hypothetical protein
MSVLTSNTLDLAPIVQPILAAAGAVIAGLLAIYVPKGLAAFQARTGILITDQQRATILGAVQTAAGVLETDIDKGVLAVSHIHASNPAVLAQAQTVIATVPLAAASLGMTPEGVARMIVGAVDTGSRTHPTVATTTGGST